MVPVRLCDEPSGTPELALKDKALIDLADRSWSRWSIGKAFTRHARNPKFHYLLDPILLLAD